MTNNKLSVFEPELIALRNDAEIIFQRGELALRLFAFSNKTLQEAYALADSIPAGRLRDVLAELS